ncbi:HNH endonuclease [Nocardia sp. NPDC056611]|uniref:HNH endonuclease n=1 Tax=Nocardia sp. NPDC056611 TaxID=3345877 RepID=UPI00367294B0
MAESVDDICGYCAHCNAPLRRKTKRGVPPKYCPTRCRQAADYLRVKADGRYEARLAAARKSPVEKSCGICGAGFASSNAHTKFCSKNCYRIHVARKERDNYWSDPAYREHRLGYFRSYNGDQRPTKGAHRAKRRGAPRGTAFRSVDVFERDGWICYLCETPIDPAAPKHSGLEPQVDHVVPLARGGVHRFENVRAAHAYCNGHKNARLLSELDLPLTLPAALLAATSA